MTVRRSNATCLDPIASQSNHTRSLPRRIANFSKLGFYLLLALITFLGICLFTPARLLFDQEALTLILHQAGPWASLLFVLGFALATSFGFPGNVTTVVGGAVFGLFWGTIWSTIGATLGAVGAFWLARYALHDWVEGQFGHYRMLQTLKQAISYNPLKFVLAVRFSPISPFSLVNFLFGLTSIDLKTYTFGTLIGIIPLSFAYAWLGVSGHQALQGGDRFPLFLALGLLSLLALLPLWMKKSSNNI
jgi:uncharacterized membrane protein YdjX (TVP38/TMEM64 family)